MYVMGDVVLREAGVVWESLTAVEWCEGDLV